MALLKQTGSRRYHWSGCYILCLGVLLLSACGFHLRGSLKEVGHLPLIYIHTERGSHIGVDVTQTFRQAGVELTDDRSQAEWVLTLSDEKEERRVLSVDSSGKVQEYELHYGLIYQLDDNNGGQLIAPQELGLVRDYSFSGTDVLAKDDEETLLYRGMREQAAQMILTRLLGLNLQDSATTMTE